MNKISSPGIVQLKASKPQIKTESNLPTETGNLHIKENFVLGLSEAMSIGLNQHQCAGCHFGLH